MSEENKSAKTNADQVFVATDRPATVMDVRPRHWQVLAAKLGAKGTTVRVAPTR